MKTLFIFIMMFFCSASYGQRNAIIGVIIDADTKIPVGNCNVFVSNTSKGSITSAEGKFFLYNLPEGKSFDLVVSSIGYETFTYTFASKQLPLNLNISLNKKLVQMENVLVAPVETNGWEKWGSLFIKNFLGESENAAECTIENIGIIQFRYSKTEYILDVSADGILVINNYRLGYIIKYKLEEFTFDMKTQNLRYVGYPLFEEMQREDMEAPKYVKRRLKAYNGSLMHFMRSLDADKLAEEGFEVRRMERFTAIDTIWHSGNGRFFSMIDKNAKKVATPYYLQRRMKERIDSSVLTRDSLLYKGTDSVRGILAFNNWLYVRYLNEKEPDEFVHSLLQHQKHNYQSSKFNILNDEKSIIIQPSGYYYPSTDLYIEGYLAWEKMGDLLPLDYEVPKEALPEKK